MFDLLPSSERIVQCPSKNNDVGLKEKSELVALTEWTSSDRFKDRVNNRGTNKNKFYLENKQIHRAEYEIAPSYW